MTLTSKKIQTLIEYNNQNGFDGSFKEYNAFTSALIEHMKYNIMKNNDPLPRNIAILFGKYWRTMSPDRIRDIKTLWESNGDGVY
jgi:hypothetical protein